MNIQTAIRNVTAKIQRELDSGRRSARLDAHDFTDALLAIADEFDAAAGEQCDLSAGELADAEAALDRHYGLSEGGAA